MAKPNLLLPSKPHFFKPLLPGFDDEFLIPVSFFKYLEGKECQNAVLTSSAGKVWPIEVKDRRFKEGWKEFATHHQLHVGDFLVFRHEGDMVFHVEVFDPSTCERQYPVFSMNDEIFDIPNEDPTAKTPILERNPEKKQHCAKASSCNPECAFFDVKLTSYSAKTCRMHMPTDFARFHDLNNRQCKMIVEDEQGRCWPTVLRSKKSDHKVFIGCGWNNCRVANSLQAGDLLRFEIIRNGAKPLLKMRRLKANSEAQRDQNFDDAHAGSSSNIFPDVSTTSKVFCRRNSQLKIPKEEVAKESGSNAAKKKQPTTSSEVKEYPYSPFFVVNMPAKRTNMYKLYVPMKFARVHFLRSKCRKIVLIGKNGRSWPAKLWYKTDDSVYITNGWGAFRVANDIMPGDTFVLELIANGKKPVLRMCENPKIEKEEVDYDIAQPSSSSSRYPGFFATMRASYLKSSQLRIPTPFARKYKQITKCSNITVIDERGSLWPVSLITKYGDIYMRSGWSEFAVANNIREGDVFMFELIENGEKPAMRISGVKRGTEEHRKYSMKSSGKGSWDSLEDVKPIIDGGNQDASV